MAKTELQELRESLDRAYTTLIDAAKLLSMRKTAAEMMEFDVKIAQAKAFNCGKISGRNDKERESVALVMFEDDLRALEQNNIDVAEAKLDYDIAELYLSRERAMLRVMELIARVQKNDEGVEDAE